MNHKILPPTPIQPNLHSSSRIDRSYDGAPPPYRASVRTVPTLDIPQRIERKLAQYNASQNVWKRWLFEIISWMTSAGCIGAIIGILLYSRDHLLSERSLSLAAYNVLSKVASAALILPISEAIGQLKWTWFHGDSSKEMIDFEIFDKASRGAWGSFLLLFRTKGQSLAALGAVLTLLLLATDTFFQQVTNYPDRWALEHLGSASPRVIRYNPFYTPEYYDGMEMTFPNPAFRPVVGQFMVNNGTTPVSFGNGTRPEIPLTCPSSNCTWPEYETLGICNECIELSNILDHGCLETNVDWSATQVGSIRDMQYPNKTVCGYFLNLTSSSPVLMSGYILENEGNVSAIGETLLVRTLPLTDMVYKSPLYGGSISFKHLRAPILDFLVVSTLNNSESVYRNATPVSHECVLAWCVQTIRSSYALGNYKEEVVSKLFNTTRGPWPWDAYPINISGEDYGILSTFKDDVSIVFPGTSINVSDPVAPSTTFGLSNTSASYVSQVFDDYFPSSYTAMTPSSRPMLRYKNFLDGPSLRKLQFNPFLAPNNVTSHMERLATALTNVVRSDLDSYEMMPGLAYNKRQFVMITWEWLIFPIALLLLSLVFLVATVLRTSNNAHREMQVWKTSAMPTLIYSLPDDVQQKLRDPQPSGEKMRKIRIRLSPNQGWRVSGHTVISPTVLTRIPQPPPGWI